MAKFFKTYNCGFISPFLVAMLLTTREQFKYDSSQAQMENCIFDFEKHFHCYQRQTSVLIEKV